MRDFLARRIGAPARLAQSELKKPLTYRRFFCLRCTPVGGNGTDGSGLTNGNSGRSLYLPVLSPGNIYLTFIMSQWQSFEADQVPCCHMVKGATRTEAMPIRAANSMLMPRLILRAVSSRMMWVAPRRSCRSSDPSSSHSRYSPDRNEHPCR